MNQTANRALLLSAKVAVVACVVWFVSGSLSDAWRQIGEQGLTIAPGYAALSGLLLLLGQLPMAWYWRRTLAALDQPAPVWPAVAAYYLSQIGKYVPGKAAVVAIRTERFVAIAGGKPTQVAASVFYETLTLMAVGGVLSAALLAARFGSREGWLAVLAATLGVACLAPIVPPVAAWLMRKLTKRTDSSESPAYRFTWSLMGEGGVYALAAWGVMATSIWAAGRAVGVDNADSDAGLWLLAAALPVVAGFLSLLPAGVVVRDGLMLKLLAPTLGEAGALATTLATRVIWIAAEALVCVILSVMVGKRSA
ncbi:MAG: lysylphosphatidylglycerol synthase domain-containing protein [Planctomycetota bacterium]